MTDIYLGYEPRAQFEGYHATDKRWRAIVAHRRAGKTVATINQLIKSALTCQLPDPRVAYMAPLRSQAKDVAWGYLRQYTAPIPGAVANESELRIDLPRGGRVRLYGADNPDALRGVYLDHCVLDEFADMRPALLPEVVRPALSDRRGGLTVIGTPRGHNDFHKVWQEAQNNPEWYALELKASETGILPLDELASLRAMMTEDEYAQEFECSFDAAIRGAYYGKEMQAAEEQGRICEVEIDHRFPVHTAWDLGVRDATAIWFFQQVHNGFHIIDYYEMVQQGVDHYAEVIRSKRYPVGTDYVPFDANVVDFSTGRTRLEQMRRVGLNPVIVPQHKIMDGIAAVRETLARVRFDRERCIQGIEALKQYRTEFDEARKVMRPTPLHDWTSHGADAFRYLAMAWHEPEQADSQRTRELLAGLKRRIV